MSSDQSSEMSDDIVTVDTAKRAREVITTLAELKNRLIYEGELSEESHALYNNIEQTLYQAIGEIYGWSIQETTQAQADQNKDGSQGRDS